MNVTTIRKILRSGRVYYSKTSWGLIVGFELDGQRVCLAFQPDEGRGPTYVFWETPMGRYRLPDSWKFEVLRAAIVALNEELSKGGLAPVQV